METMRKNRNIHKLSKYMTTGQLISRKKKIGLTGDRGGEGTERLRRLRVRGDRGIEGTEGQRGKRGTVEGT
jgi:hypothetical protein